MVAPYVNLKAVGRDSESKYVYRNTRPNGIDWSQISLNGKNFVNGQGKDQAGWRATHTCKEGTIWLVVRVEL